MENLDTLEINRCIVFITKPNMVDTSDLYVNVAEVETKDARIAEYAIRERIRYEEEEIAPLMRRKRLYTYHYNDGKTAKYGLLNFI